MKQEELEEKVTMMEELIQGFVQRMEAIEAGWPELMQSFLQQYKDTLSQISDRIETANKRYDDQKIAAQIDEVKAILGTVPKVITVKNEVRHHFGAWSKNLIIGVVSCCSLTSLSVGTALYLNHENNRLVANDIKYRALRQVAPASTHWADSTYNRDPETMEKNTVQLEDKALEKAEAEVTAKEKAADAKQAQKRLDSLSGSKTVKPRNSRRKK